MKPLEGLVVLDLTRFLAGPYCTLLLAGLGAEVIRVQPPSGDPYRDRPPFAGPKGTSFTRQTDDDVNVAILHRARGKKSVTLNLREPAGIELFHKLAAHADVVVENYLPGTIEKMGLGFPVLQALNPRIILCSISGFGQRGPYRDWRAFDPIVQGMSGIASVTGDADRPPGVRCGALVSDTSSALYAMIGILSALRARERTGQGDWIDVAMLDGSFFLLADVLEYAVAGAPPERHGNAHAGTVPFNVYPARDGWVTICAVTADEWLHVLKALGREDLVDDPRFEASAASRADHREEIDGLVGAWIGKHTTAEAVAILQKAGVPAGPVLDVPQALADEHLHAREMVVDLEHPTHGRVPGLRGAGMPIKFRNHRAAFDAPAPALGAHNEDVYGRFLGLTQADVAKLAADGVI
jgi:crotonobetainyl-CoA:carnitine CoA-transferase CaiB-like acyl-CoA transferase